ncbi:hypothetical protein [Chryseobacterium sp. HR92]|uniref:hypothetical protein n=1 Tax=Chryseobacterium sp. HR92 TaxID=3094839 RepID=UPI0038910C84|nr:hypothetical protein SFA27_22620 [Chryseobacterium sp. HR92]
MNKPQILTLNITQKTKDLLINNDFNITEGSLGKTVNLKDKTGETFCLTGQIIPNNLHEFDIVIVDLTNEEIIDYDEKQHIRTVNKTGKDLYILCKPPMNLFDPRGVSAHFLEEKIKSCFNKDFMLIVFQNEYMQLTYEFYDKKSRQKQLAIYNLYEFVPKLPSLGIKYGLKTQLAWDKKQNEFHKFLTKYQSEYIYHNIFEPPTVWKEGERKPDPHFFPLLVNNDGDIVSYTYGNQISRTYLFPELKDNSTFLLEFLQEIAPTIQPELFPFSSQKKWTSQNEYALPNHSKLIEEKLDLEKEYEEKVNIKNDEISKNIEKYQFLHNLLTETGDSLVTAVIEYLEWLGLSNVVDMDEQLEEGEKKEEDIQIENEKGLLVIEVKGIGGTSKDSECSQISKIKYRRAKERNKFDVFGLYIVNHQRHIPALNRSNPPFSEHQINDAINEERGLLTTWQLFQLYYDIENGIISKGEARDRLYDYGLISFIPHNIVEIGTVTETFKENKVLIFTINNTLISVGNILFIRIRNRFKKVRILEIKFNDKNVESIENGEVGILVDIPVPKNSTVFMQQENTPQENA